MTDISYFRISGETDRKYGLEDWECGAGFDDNGKVWMPASLFGNEVVLFCMAMYDGQEIAELDDHLFLMEDYIKKLFPDFEKDTDDLVRKIKKEIMSRLN